MTTDIIVPERIENGQPESFPGENFILNRINAIGWEDRYMFSKILAAGNGIISILPMEGYERWMLHQKWNREMHSTRASKIGIPMVVGFFCSGEAEELSLFEPCRFKDASRTQLWDGYVIGRGCEDMAHDMWADFETSIDHQFDEGFSMGGEEYYRAATRTYYRCSATGRHCYLLTIGPDNLISKIETEFERPQRVV